MPVQTRILHTDIKNTNMKLQNYISFTLRERILVIQLHKEEASFICKSFALSNKYKGRHFYYQVINL